MKRLLLILTLVLLIGGLVLGAILLMGQQPSKPVSNQQSQASGSSGAELGVMKPIDTHADAMEALSYEISQNQDTVGWVKVPETSINNSVLQAHSNEAYLRTNERGQDDVYGSYFVDYECSVGSREVLSPNTIIYGHSDLKDNPEGPRFSQLFKFTDAEFAKNTPYLYFSTIEDYMVWEIFAVLYTDTKMQYIYPNLEEQQLTDLIKEAKLKSIYNYNVDVSGSDKILTLSTCSRKFGQNPEQRFVIMAKLIDKEAQEKLTAELTVNPSPVMPKFN